MTTPESVSAADAETSAAPTTTTFAAPRAPSDSDPRWRRTHPASPWLENVTALAVGAYLVLREAQSMVRNQVDLVNAFRGGSVWFWLLVTMEAFVVLAMIYNVIAWRHRWFLIADDAIHVRSGRLSRTVTTVPLDRVQSVDVVQPFTPRLFGFAKLTVEVAGDDGSAVTLTLLRQSDAQRVRARLLGVGTEASGEGAEPAVLRDRYLIEAHEAGDDGTIAIVPPERVKRATLRSPGPWGAAAAVLGSVGLIVGGIVFGDPATALSAIVMVVGSGVGLAKAVFGVLERSSGFRVMAVGDALRVHHGLAERHQRTITPRRVQAVTLSQPIWWRAPGWWAVKVTVPGLEDEDDETKASSSDLFPLATRDEALRLIALALPGVPPSDVIARTMTGQRLTGSGYLAAPRRARLFSPLGWRHEGVLVTSHALVVRHGRWNRKVTVLRHEHPQVLRIRQGWWARRWRLADVTFELPGKNLTVNNLDVDDAQNLFREQVHRAS